MASPSKKKAYAILSFGARNQAALNAAMKMVQYLRDSLGWEKNQIWIDSEQIGMNPNWRALFQDAQSHADIHFFMISRAWFDSPNCQRELQWFLSNHQASYQAYFVGVENQQELLSHPMYKEVMKIAQGRFSWIFLANNSGMLLSHRFNRKHTELTIHAGDDWKATLLLLSNQLGQTRKQPTLSSNAIPDAPTVYRSW
jgi:hypothetical protein